MLHTLNPRPTRDDLRESAKLAGLRQVQRGRAPEAPPHIADLPGVWIIGPDGALGYVVSVATDGRSLARVAWTDCVGSALADPTTLRIARPGDAQ